jgi:hypothetical protein
LHSSEAAKSSDSVFTPNPMWRCSSRATLCMPALKAGIVPAFVKKSSM